MFVLLCSDSDEDTSEKSIDEDHQLSALEELTDLHFKFEIKEVCSSCLRSGYHVTSCEGGAYIRLFNKVLFISSQCETVACGVFRCCWS